MARAQDPIKARSTATQIVRTLRAAGHNALFAGGCVRDELLGLRPTDYDVATSATPPQVRALFRSVHEVGEAFGVMLVTLDHTTVEAATFRTDGDYTDKRRPDTVTFADDRADARRRDFTVNALFLDPTEPGVPPARSPLGGRVIDYVDGMADLQARTIRAVGDPNARLNEDHLRALRAVRFASRLGFTIEPATAAAIRAHTSQLVGISRERIGEELRRMLTHPRQGARQRAVGLLEELNLDTPVLDEPHRAGPNPSSDALPTPAPFPAALAAWLVDRHSLYLPAARPLIGRMVTHMRSALCLTNTERDALRDLLECVGEVLAGWQGRRPAGQKRWASRQGFGAALDILSPHHPGLIEHIRRSLDELCHDGIGLSPDPLVDGDALVELGFRPGPVFKSLLDRLYDEQLEGRLKSRSEGLELARIWGV